MFRGRGQLILYFIVVFKIYWGCSLPLLQELLSVSSQVRDNYTVWCILVLPGALYYITTDTGHWCLVPGTVKTRLRRHHGPRHRLHLLRVTNIVAGMLLFWFWVRCLDRVRQQLDHGNLKWSATVLNLTNSDSWWSHTSDQIRLDKTQQTINFSIYIDMKTCC